MNCESMSLRTPAAQLSTSKSCAACRYVSEFSWCHEGSGGTRIRRLLVLLYWPLWKRPRHHYRLFLKCLSWLNERSETPAPPPSSDFVASPENCCAHGRWHFPLTGRHCHFPTSMLSCGRMITCFLTLARSLTPCHTILLRKSLSRQVGQVPHQMIRHRL